MLIFAVNPLHNVIHLALAILWPACTPRHRAARVANLVCGVLLHLITATLALYFGSVAAERSRIAGPPSLTRDLFHYSMPVMVIMGGAAAGATGPQGAGA